MSLAIAFDFLSGMNRREAIRLHKTEIGLLEIAPVVFVLNCSWTVSFAHLMVEQISAAAMQWFVPVVHNVSV